MSDKNASSSCELNRKIHVTFIVSKTCPQTSPLVDVILLYFKMIFLRYSDVIYELFGGFQQFHLRTLMLELSYLANKIESSIPVLT